MSFDVTKPADNEFIAAGPAEMRENFRALKDDRIVDAGSVQGLTPGNDSGHIAVANGNLCTNLNAEKVGGKLAADLAAVNHTHAVATGSSNGFMANTDKQKLDTVTAGAQPNQNAFANVLVGTTTIQADSSTDVLELVAGTGITFTPDAANDRLTITGHSSFNDPDANQKAALAGTSGSPSGTNKYVTNSDVRLTTVQNAVNVTTSINGQAITTIFEVNGITVKNATNAVNATNGVPAGTIIFHAGSTSPTGYIKCNGATISRTTYAALFAAIGTTWGPGDGSTTFTLPDLRGEFVRGWDDGRGVDLGRGFGSWQGSQNLSHSHGGSTGTDSPDHTHFLTAFGNSGYNPPWGNYWGQIQTNNSFTNQYTAGASARHTHSLSINNDGGGEARSRNIALLACIKY